MNAYLKNYLRLAVILAATAWLLFGTVLPAVAAPIVPAECRAGGSGCTLCHIGILAMNLTDYLIYYIALPATMLLVAAGGTMLLISGSSEQRRTLGKNILTSTLIGVVIVFLAWLGVDTIIKLLTLGKDALITGTGVGPWHTIDPSACPL